MTVLVREKSDGEWFGSFPFTGEFEQVVDGIVSIEYVKQLVSVLEPAVRVFSDVVEGGDITTASVRSLFFLVNALARCRVALAYECEVADAGIDKLSLLEALKFEWERMVLRECLVSVEYAPVVGAAIGSSVKMLWAPSAMQGMHTARDLCRLYPSFITDMRVVPVAQVLVVGDRGLPLNQVLSLHGDKPVLPVNIYRQLLQRVKGVELAQQVQRSPQDILGGCIERMDIGFGYLETDKVSAWLWLVLATLGEMHGYCYQLLYPPACRFAACLVLGQQPVVRDLVSHLEQVNYRWSDVDAQMCEGESLHVTTAGNADVCYLRQKLNCSIGMLRGSPKQTDVDYYARALVDEFLAKHKPLPAVSEAPPPLDAEFDMLSLDSSSAAGREFIDVATLLYSAVDESISPRAEAGDNIHATFAAGDEFISERDSEIVQEIYNRLADGAVIDESYFDRTYRRFRKLHRRPRLERSDGRLYHVFEGFPADGGAGVGPWILDKNWGIPGWRSYTAHFPMGDVRTVSFTVEGGCQDVRMDCSGEGAIELGDCKTKVQGTLLWFTGSIRLKLIAKTNVCLRISVPDALSAVAMGAEMRKYMHIPGYAVVARCYDVVTGSVDFNIPMERVKRNSIAGCHVYTGQRYVERGRHRFKLSQVVSLAPARVLLKTEPPDALQFVSVCGMRLHPRTRDHVSVLIDLRNVEMYISVGAGATLLASMMQIVRVKEYELTIVSTKEAKAARSVQ